MTTIEVFGYFTYLVHDMIDDSHDPDAEPKFDPKQIRSPLAPRPRGTPRDIDPHAVLNYNGLLPVFLGGDY